MTTKSFGLRHRRRCWRKYLWLETWWQSGRSRSTRNWGNRTTRGVGEEESDIITSTTKRRVGDWIFHEIIATRYQRWWLSSCRSWNNRCPNKPAPVVDDEEEQVETQDMLNLMALWNLWYWKHACQFCGIWHVHLLVYTTQYMGSNFWDAGYASYLHWERWDKVIRNLSPLMQQLVEIFQNQGWGRPVNSWPRYVSSYQHLQSSERYVSPWRSVIKDQPQKKAAALEYWMCETFRLLKKGATIQVGAHKYNSSFQK